MADDLRSIYEHTLAGSRNGDDKSPAPYVAVRLADVEPEQVRWLWPGRLAVGKLVVLDGDPGVAKSTIALDLAARISTGRAMPDEPELDAEPRDVVLMSAEDGLADTIRPRLDFAGADVSRVHALTEVLVPAGDETLMRPPVLPDDLDRLEALVVERRAALVVVDVLMAYLSADTNSYRDQDVRRALAPLAAMAERQACCILVLRHLRKASTGTAVYAGGGSIGIVGAARVGLMAGYDPDDDELDDNDRRRVLAVVKCNVARKASSLSYRVVDADGVGCIEWLGPVAHRADDLVATDHDRERVDRETFLAELLDDGPVAAREVERAAHDAGGWTVKQLRPVLRRMGGSVLREGFGPGGRWLWSITEPAHSSPVGAVDAHISEREPMAPMGHLSPDVPTLEELW